MHFLWNNKCPHVLGIEGHWNHTCAPILCQGVAVVPPQSLSNWMNLGPNQMLNWVVVLHCSKLDSISLLGYLVWMEWYSCRKSIGSHFLDFGVINVHSNLGHSQMLDWVVVLPYPKATRTVVHIFGMEGMGFPTRYHFFSLEQHMSTYPGEFVTQPNVSCCSSMYKSYQMPFLCSEG